MTEADARGRAVDAFMALAAERPFERITFADVASRAGLGLADLREAFDTVPDIVAAFMQRTDRRVLESSTEDMAGEPPRERLFDVLMRRFDELKPHRPALRSIVEGLRRDPFLAAAWNRRGVVSMAWMLAAANIETGGVLGRIRAQGLVFAYAGAFRVFLRDDDEGLARTMAELDRRLRSGERRLATVCRLAGPLGRRPARRRSPDDLYADYPA